MHTTYQQSYLTFWLFGWKIQKWTTNLSIAFIILLWYSTNHYLFCDFDSDSFEVFQQQLLDSSKSEAFTSPLHIQYLIKIDLIVMFVQVTLEHNSNSTNSVLKFVPDISDAGKFLKCRAENIEMTASQLEDSRNLEINCKTHNWIPPRRFPGPFI